MDWEQGKPSRYPFEADVALGDQVESGPLVSNVPPFSTVPGSTVGTPRDPCVSAAIVDSLVDYVAVEKVPAGVAMIGAELALKKCVFCEINEKLMCANVPSILPL